MRKSFAAAFAAGLFIFWNIVYAAPEETPDGRFGTECQPRAFGNTCMLSFYRLLASPEKYHGKLVFVSGFLIKLYGVEPMLFASRDSYNTGLPIEGIFVDAPIPPGIASHLEAYRLSGS